MNRTLEIYNELRLKSLDEGVRKLESEKDAILDSINRFVYSKKGDFNELLKSICFFDSDIYEKHLKKISLLNFRLSNLESKKIKLTSFPFELYNAS